MFQKKLYNGMKHYNYYYKQGKVHPVTGHEGPEAE